MEGLTQEFVQQVGEQLSQLSSPSNELRIKTEENIKNVFTQNPDLLLAGVSQILTIYDSSDIMRSMASIVLRQYCLSNSNNPTNTNLLINGDNAVFLYTIKPNTQEFIKKQLIDSLNNEPNVSVRRNVAETISAITECIYMSNSLTGSKNQWNELLETLFTLITQETNKLAMSSSFQIIARFPELIAQVEPSVLKEVFRKNFQMGNVDTRVDAINATVRYLILMAEDDDEDNEITQQFLTLKERKRRINEFKDLIPDMFGVLATLDSSGNYKELDEALTSIIEFADIHSKLIKPIFPQVIEFCKHLLENKSIQGSIKQSALELLLTIAESSPGMTRKNQVFITFLIQYLMELMTKIDIPDLDDLALSDDSNDEEDEEDWANRDEEDDLSDSVDAISGQALDRISCALGGMAILPIASKFIPQFISSSNWKYRHAALMTLSAIAEGCVKVLKPEMKNVLSMVVPLLKDPNPRVKWAACNCIGQMSTDFSPLLQTKYVSLILPSLIETMNDSNIPRVRTHAAAALVNFSQESDRVSITPYLEPLFNQLLNMLSQGTPSMQKQAITSIATVADSAEDEFVQYYPTIMPILLQALQNADGDEHKLLRGKIMECASLIALTVGKDVFEPHREIFMNLLKIRQEQVVDSDDPQYSYLLSAWARIAKVVGINFVPYLNYVLPPLLANAQLKPDLAVLESGSKDAEEHEQDPEWECFDVKGKKVGIRTSILEEKCTAIELLICYARDLREHFAPYAEQVLKIIVPLLKFYFHEGVRYASASLIPLLFSSLIRSQIKPREEIIKEWKETFSILINVLENEDDPIFLSHSYTCISDTISAISLGPGDKSILDYDLLLKFGFTIKKQVEQYFDRVKDREERRLDEDHDQDEEDILIEEQDSDERFLTELSSAIHSIFRISPFEFLQVFSITKLLDLTKIFTLIGSLSEIFNEKININAISKEQGEQIMNIQKEIKNILGNNKLDFNLLFSMANNYNDLEDSKLSIAGSLYQWALCVYDDIIEYTSIYSVTNDTNNYQNYSHDLINNYFVCFINGISSKIPEIRQSSAYGIGLMAQFGGSKYWGLIASTLNKLTMASRINFNSEIWNSKPNFEEVIPYNDNDEDYNTNLSRENCVSAMSKIILYSPEIICMTTSEIFNNENIFNIQDIPLFGKLNNKPIKITLSKENNQISQPLLKFIEMFIESLPILEDIEECSQVYRLLIELIETQNTLFIDLLFSNNDKRMVYRLINIIKASLNHKEDIFPINLNDTESLGYSALEIQKENKINEELITHLNLCLDKLMTLI